MPRAALPNGPRIDDPIELLLACHEKVRRFTSLSLKLQDHVATQGADGQAADAARAILRYFDVAAPLHHADEDEDLYPALLGLADASLAQTIQRIQDEHQELNRLWQACRPWLTRVSEAGSLADPGDVPPAPDAIGVFAARYGQHAAQEEQWLFPQAQRLSEAQRQAICAAMVARRTT
ncbi:hemerythrin domain-containing protein [Aquabacterium sp.]|jgi:hemerythrin-like domain-containing protein|uniref:hemerythrin domain-containing protein n=1 Tax=Aquabacterium sp. TaxID=1872578 RepID=UPI0025C3932A|nr:hemerythrin domain-containing protein [Aquabacterium sp.]